MNMSIGVVDGHLYKYPSWLSVFCFKEESAKTAVMPPMQKGFYHEDRGLAVHRITVKHLHCLGSNAGKEPRGWGGDGQHPSYR